MKPKTKQPTREILIDDWIIELRGTVPVTSNLDKMRKQIEWTLQAALDEINHNLPAYPESATYPDARFKVVISK